MTQMSTINISINTSTCIRQKVYLSNTATNFNLKLGHLRVLNI